ESQAIISAIGAEADKDEVKHLGKGQRNHDEGNALCTQCNGTGHQPRQPTSKQSDQQVQQSIVQTMEAGNGGAVNAQAQKEGMAEADHATIAQHQIKCSRGDSQDDDAAHQSQSEGVIGDD